MNFEIDDTFLLTHGSRQDFQHFNLDYVGTGERAGPGFGLHFTDNVMGAVAHAEGYTRSSGDPIVYICRIKSEPLILRRQTPIAKHSKSIISQWGKLPCSCLEFVDSPDWYSKLDSAVYELIHSKAEPSKKEINKLKFLKNNGFDYIFNFEAGFEDAYLKGDVILLLNEEKIEIVEKHHAIDLRKIFQNFEKPLYVGKEISTDIHENFNSFLKIKST